MRKIVRNIRNMIKEVKDSGGKPALFIRAACMLFTIAAELICMLVLISLFAKDGGYSNQIAKLKGMSIPFTKGNFKLFYSGFPIVLTIICILLCLASNFVSYYMSESKAKKITLTVFFADTVVFWALGFWFDSGKASSQMFKSMSPATALTVARVFAVIALINTIGLIFLLMKKSTKGVLHVFMAAALGFMICPALTFVFENLLIAVVLLVLYVLAKIRVIKSRMEVRRNLRMAGYSKEVIKAVTSFDKKATLEEKEKALEESLQKKEEKRLQKEEKAKKKAVKKRDKATFLADKQNKREKVGLDFLDRDENNLASGRTTAISSIPSGMTLSGEALEAPDEKADNMITATTVPHPQARKIDCDAENGLEVRQGISPTLEEEVDVYSRNWMGAATKLCTLEEFKEGRAEIYYKGERIMQVKAPDFPF